MKQSQIDVLKFPQKSTFKKAKDSFYQDGKFHLRIIKRRYQIFGDQENIKERKGRWLEYFIHLIPILLVGLSAYLSSAKIQNIQINRFNYSNFLVYLAFLIPLVAQVACLPLYLIIGDELYKNKEASVEKIILENIPTLWPITTILAGGLIFLISAISNVSFQVSTHVFLSISLHVMFTLFLVYGSIKKEWPVWILTWFVYAFTNYFFVKYYYLAPIFGSLFMGLIVLKRNKEQLRLNFRFNSLYSMLKGFSLGSILWMDKIILYMLFLNKKENLTSFDAGILFVSLFPTVLALNYYYVFRTPKINRKLNELMVAMQTSSINYFFKSKRSLYRKVFVTYFQVITINFTFSLGILIYFYKVKNLSFNSLLIPFVTSFCLGSATAVLNSLSVIKYDSVIFFAAGIHLFALAMALLFGQLTILCFSSALLLLGILYIAKREWNRPHMSILRG